MMKFGRVLLVLGFTITVLSILYLAFGSMEFPRGATIGDLEYHSKIVHAYVPVLACVIASVLLSVVLWRANRH